MPRAFEEKEWGPGGRRGPELTGHDGPFGQGKQIGRAHV